MSIKWYLVPLLVCFISMISSEMVINNKTVVSTGGPGLTHVMDKYNQEGNWNREYQPTEPQQIHTTWVSDGKQFKVQFSTLSNIKSASLIYWLSDEDQDMDSIVIREAKSWKFVDGGKEKRSQYMHTFITRHLFPFTRYKYKIMTLDEKEKALTSDIFELHTPDIDSFQFLATGDIGIVNAVSIPLFRNLTKTHEYDFITIMGDQAYDMADFEGVKGDDYMNFVQDIYGHLPVLATAGNHEYHYNFSHYKNRFDLMPYKESYFPDAMQYSIDYKSLHLISFATEVFFEGSEVQIETSLNWLDQDLKRATQNRDKRPWIIVMGHRPLYCSITSNKDCAWKAERLRFGGNHTRGLETLLTKYQVDLYLCGHKHNYERTFPVRNNTLLTTSYRNPPSFFQVITGNAGNYEGPDKFDLTAAVPDWLGKRYQGYGYSAFRVTRSTLDLHHYQTTEQSQTGKLMDHVVVTKSESRIHKQMLLK